MMARSTPQDFEKLTSALTETTRIAAELTKSARSVREMVTDVTEKSGEALEKLTPEAARAIGSEVTEFKFALGETQKMGRDLIDRCSELCERWGDFYANTDRLFKRKQISSADVHGSVRQLELMLQQAGKCGAVYQQFNENLSHALEVGSRLEERCKVEAKNARNGMIVNVVLGIVLGVSCVLTAGMTCGLFGRSVGKVRQLRGMISEFNDLRGRLGDSLRQLSQLENSVSKLITITGTMAKSMEISLNFFRHQDRVQEENEQLKQRVKQLERQVQRFGI